MPKIARFKRTIKTAKTVFTRLFVMQLFGVFVINLKQLIMKGTLRLFLTLCMAVPGYEVGYGYRRW